MRTLVILPTYNEAENIERSIQQLFEHNPEVDALVVDDGSPDGTAKLVTTLAQSDPRIHLLERASKEGLGTAYLAGFAWGLDRGYELLVEMDADGSHRAVDLPRMLAAANSADLVIGSRWIAGGEVVNWPAHRRFLSRMGNRYARTLLRSRIHDLTAGFRVYRAEVLRQLTSGTISAQGYSFQVELAWLTERAQFRVVEVPITFIERVNGRSKMSSAIVLEALWLITRWGFFGKK
jgi:dolichol-phosphate mannosyltransferase